MKKYWFKDKEYGWGWRPATWEGWAVTGLFLFLLMVRTLHLSLLLPHDPSGFALFAYSVDVLGLVGLLLIISSLSGEKPHWRWGGEKVSAEFALSQSLILFAFILVTFVVGFLGSDFTVIDSWYRTLEKPLLNPPEWVFAPVWSLLYLLMSIAAYMAWYHIRAHRTAILALYAVNLVLNALWSYVFFSLQNIGLAFIIILLLDCVVAVLTIRFLSWWRSSGYLMIPYLLWVLFATYLNLHIFLIN